MKKTFIASSLGAGLVLTSVITPVAHATNGMALSGYCPVAMSLGGAAVAYDNGDYGAINNPATLGLMEEGSRLEAGVNIMHVDAKTWMPGIAPLSSSADWFFMPTISYLIKDGRWTYGLGVFSQGGMGADYGRDSFLSMDPDRSTGGPTGLPDESEVMIGRLIFPVAFEATDRLTLGSSIDAVYGRFTMKQVMPREALMDMLSPGRQTLGVDIADPHTLEGLGLANYAHFDLEKLDNWGYGGQVGLTFRATDALTLGASYQFETNLGDLEADAYIQAGMGNRYQSIPGTAKIEDFQWPATWKFGAAFRATDRLLLVADIKRYKWSDVLDSVRIRFTPDAGGFVNVDMYQQWDGTTRPSIPSEANTPSIPG